MADAKADVNVRVTRETRDRLKMLAASYQRASGEVCSVGHVIDIMIEATYENMEKLGEEK